MGLTLRLINIKLFYSVKLIYLNIKVIFIVRASNWPSYFTIKAINTPN